MAGGLYISEYTDVIHSPDGVPIALEATNARQKVTVGAGSTQSAAFQVNTKIVRLHVDTNPVCVVFGTNPTATANDARIMTNTTEYFAVPQGQAFKVAGFPTT